MTEELNRLANNWFQKNWNEYFNEVSKNIAWGQMSEYASDLCIECYEAFMKQSDSRKHQMITDGRIMGFLLHCCSFQIRSGTSPFYNKYRKQRVGHIPDYYADNEGPGYEMDEINIDDYYGCMKKAMTDEGIGWYYSKILELKYIQNMTFEELENQYGICSATLRRDIKLALESVEKYCNHLN